MSTSGVISSSLSSSIRIAFDMYFPICLSLRNTTQQESILRTPPTTIFPSFTWYVEARLIIFQNPQRTQTQANNKFNQKIYLQISGTQKNLLCDLSMNLCKGYNNFNLAGGMSASLPRIKSVHEMGKRGSMDIPAALKVKFRRLTLEEPAENVEQRRKSLKTIKSSRLNSIERYTNAQEQREYKNEKIHLNLIERKLLAGTYDEKLETGNELTALKHRRDQMRVDMATQQKEIERVKALLEDVRQETQVFLSKKGEHDERLKELKERSDAQVLRAEAARETRSVLENMIRTRQEINILLGKRHNAAKDELNRLRNCLALMDNQLREASEKYAVQQAKLDTILKQVQREKQERTEQIDKHQERITRRKEGEILQKEKSRKYIAHLDDVERQGEVRDFHSIYDKILANIFVARYAKITMQDLRERFEKYETAFNVVRAYRSFDTESPHTLVERFLEHSPELTQLQADIQRKEEVQTALEAKREELKQTLQKMAIDGDQLDQGFRLNHHAQIMAKQREEVKELRREAEEAEEKTVRIKNGILMMMKELNQKADKRVFTGSQTTFNNLTLLTNLLRDAFRKLQ